MRVSFVGLFDGRGRLVHISERGSTLEGEPDRPDLFDIASLRGRYATEFVHPDDREAYRVAFSLCLRTGKQQRIIIRRTPERADFDGQREAVWLERVNRPRDCEHACVAILVKVLFIPPRIERLSKREREVLFALARGTSAARIANGSHRARGTVRTLFARARKKLVLEDSVELGAWAATYRELLPLDLRIP